MSRGSLLLNNVKTLHEDQIASCDSYWPIKTLLLVNVMTRQQVRFDWLHTLLLFFHRY